MNEDKNQNLSTSDEKSGVVDKLHNTNTLPSLRTYQGDVAEFIKDKNESVTSIAVKEKEKRREEEREQSVAASKKGDGFKINFMALVLSLLLIIAGSLTVFFVMRFLQNKEPIVTLKQEIIPYNSELSIANVTKDSIATELSNIPKSGGVTAIRLSDTNGKSINTTNILFSFLGVIPPGTINRSLKPEFFFGALSQEESTDYFIIMGVDDFGVAFAGMLDWESNLEKDLSFITNKQPEVMIDLDDVDTSVALWKDVIIRNKDTRALMSANRAIVAYTFLDKNTILITNSLDSIGEISSIFAAKSVVR